MGIEPQLVGRAEAAKAFGVVPARINRWVADGAPVAQKGERGKPALYDVEALRRWRDERQAASQAGLSLEEERAKLAREQHIRAARENLREEGELVEFEKAAADGEAYTKAWQAKVRGFPRRLTQAGIIDRKDEPQVAAICRELLTEISSWRTLADLRRASRQRAS